MEIFLIFALAQIYRPLLLKISHGKLFKTVPLKGVFAKNERVYRLTAKNKGCLSLLILHLSVVSIREKKMLKTTHTEERSVHASSDS